ncbi:ubiquitin carboxyl-terminal hydrolase 14 isoform X3 [Ostrinia furnacalis]|uniref:ubiquitin carboxyl-terminal hydrolase 14 isoform X1 n=1 Tax=Ostrinia furnacalis TaxID=93504 RepID=UPI00103C8B78|nr:ubiquitin carboxyl-terminal hydrolase 14 isoform X1 [Ostrinia furnacalis]XP_028163287.1 ubiquitin carboxyl-terminal hydrolase 14 isoform X2 [Ostrinia furnacalis]XP_028163288.1 ubiquitin carboxyl-terminal hydrolase 14 isoform X3 [Ostrinia furnacalis]
MPKVSVKVKWGKEMYPGVEVNTDEDPVLFKAQIFALTGVQPERQKVVCKGVTLRDDAWGNFKLTNNALVLVMGSKEEDVPAVPVEPTRFVEDMNEAELATALDLPEGLINLGNTCYMNATVQCLKTVPELKNALLNYDKSSGGGNAGELTVALSETMSALEGGGAGACAGAAARLLRALHSTAPRFAERGPGGGLAQQDASECWAEIVRALQQRLPAPPGVPADRSNVIEQYFGGTLDVELVCSEAEEPPTRSSESFLQLSCFISQDVKYLQSGLRSKMSEQITKMSQTLGRDAVYTKTSKISRLPAYLTVQFVRFYYKEKEAINAKILKDVKFPLDLDVYELCSPELQERLAPMRAKFKEVDDANVESSLTAKNKPHGDSKKESKNKRVMPYWFENDVGSNNSGFYRLQAVLTHRGRSSSSGHYVAWVARAGGWLRCDDDAVTPVPEEEVLKLSGGGDWHCAYLLLYGPRVLELPSEDEPMVTEVTETDPGVPPTALA